MDEMVDFMLGVDKKNEIFNLWYEVTFLRMVLTHVVQSNPALAENLSQMAIDGCRGAAQQIVQERFPLIKIDFSEPSPEQIEKKKKHMENLKTLNGVFGFSERQKEDPACTPDTPSQEPDAPLAP